jgi:hypothetical protein
MDSKRHSSRRSDAETRLPSSVREAAIAPAMPFIEERGKTSEMPDSSFSMIVRISQ